MMDLRCQLRFVDAPGGKRAILDAGSADGSVRLTVEADGEDQGSALVALAARTRELYASICTVVDTVEELERTYFSNR